MIFRCSNDELSQYCLALHRGTQGGIRDRSFGSVYSLNSRKLFLNKSKDCVARRLRQGRWSRAYSLKVLSALTLISLLFTS